MGNKEQTLITRELVKSLFGYDKDGLYRVVNRNKGKVGGRAYKANPHGYKGFKLNGRLHLEHRLVWLYHFDESPEVIDHINGNPADNRIENLRKATHSQNHWNSKLDVRNKSGVKGVSWASDRNKWVAVIRCNNKIHRVGTFATLDTASSAMALARNSLHKQFANFGV